VIRLLRRLYTRVGFAIGYGVGFCICEPKLRLGRRRHSNECDRCGDACGRYAAEKLDFPIDDLGSDATTFQAKIWAMWNAQYRRVCLECAAEIEGEGGGGA